MKKIIAIVLSVLMLLSVLAGCAAGSTEGKLVYATSADYPPFEFHMLDENGKDVIVGIDVSVAKKIAEDMGLELEIVDISFDNLLTAMDKGECDMVIAECTCPSLGVGYELAYAEKCGKPCHIFYNKTKAHLSAMLTGNPYFSIYPYENDSAIFAAIDTILKTFTENH